MGQMSEKERLEKACAGIAEGTIRPGGFAEGFMLVRHHVRTFPDGTCEQVAMWIREERGSFFDCSDLSGQWVCMEMGG